MAHLVVGVIFIVEYLKDEGIKVLTSPPPLLKKKKIISGGFSLVAFTLKVLILIVFIKLYRS